jgi:hypothetical protein
VEAVGGTQFTMVNILRMFEYEFAIWINKQQKVWRVSVIVFNATINNISAISWRSLLLVKEAGVPGENRGVKHNNTNSSDFLLFIYSYCLWTHYEIL